MQFKIYEIKSKFMIKHEFTITKLAKIYIWNSNFAKLIC